MSAFQMSAFQMCLSNVPFKCQLVCRYNLVDLRQGGQSIHTRHVIAQLKARPREIRAFYWWRTIKQTSFKARNCGGGVNKRL